MAKDGAYRKAEKKIEEARLSGAIELNLSGWSHNSPKLTELPESIGQLTQLQSINLSYNQLTTLPESIGQLTQLPSLNLSNNQLTTLPESIGQLTQLQSINLSYNKLTTLPESIGQLTQLPSLNLSNNQLTTLPESIGQLTQLRSLALSYNKLTTLPESIGQLTRLQSLALYNNQLTILPESIGQLTQLRSLNLSNNQLTTLPESIGQLTQLQSLVLYNNQLTILPESIGQLTQLQSLVLYNNQLTTLPESIGQLTQLQSLVPYNNQLTTLPESIGQLTQLPSLDLHNNQLTTLPESIGQLTRLPSLDLHNNQLTTLPESIGQLTQLQSINLSYNKLTTLPESIGQLTQLQSLVLYNNKLTTLPESIGQLTQLPSLNLSNNQLTTLPESIGQLTQLPSLNLSYNKLTTLPESIGQLTQLQSLALSYNQLTTLPESIGQLTQLQSLDLYNNQLTTLPESIGQLTRLQSLALSYNQLTTLPESIGQLTQLPSLDLHNNQLTTLPESIGQLTRLPSLDLHNNQLTTLPESIGQLTQLQSLNLSYNKLTTLPESIGQLTRLQSLALHNNQLTTLPTGILQLHQLLHLILNGNPLNPELDAAYKDGFNAIKQYLRTKEEKQIVLNEAKLILIGEGAVGKSCLLAALRGDAWIEGSPTTHGIEIKPVKVIDQDSGTEITMNGWDFGGQRVYRPTHQLFFTAPAVYLVVWKPREGPQQGFVKEWIKLVKHREPDAKILVVATHGGPGQRQPDVDRQELWDLFGHNTVQHFFLVDSKPDEQTGERYGINELKDAIARIAASLPEVGRTVPARWQEAREALKQTEAAYLPLEHVLDICHKHEMDEEEARLFVSISRRLGHLIHYEHDPILQDIVIIRPDWLATAISFVLDDKQTRDAHGLVSFARLGQLWNDPAKEEENRYSSNLHLVFLRLMERFDISYRVRGLRDEGQQDETSLIAQLVPDNRPQDDLDQKWTAIVSAGDEQQVQICRIVDAKNGQSANAEGLFYQLIVRLHKFSLGRVRYNESIHWKRGLVLDYEYNGQALLENIGNDVRITVRAPSPVTFLSILTHEVKWLVENFWEGLRCEVVVPCIEPCGHNDPGLGVFEVQKLIAFKRQGMNMFPCFVSGCSQLQDIDCLLRNAPATRRTPIEQLLTQEFEQMRSRLDNVREQLNQQDQLAEERFQVLDLNDRRMMSQVEDAYRGLMQSLTDEAKEGPRLFSFQPVISGFLDLPTWISQKFLLTLWCEHSRLPLPALNIEQDKKKRKSGMYELELSRDWFVRAAPFLKVLTGTLSLVLPVASSAVKLALDDTVYKGIEKQLDLGQKAIESVGKGMEKAKDVLGQKSFDVEHGEAIAAQGAILRQLHVLLKQKDPSFGGLIRVQNKRQEFLWVHPQFEKEY